MDPATLQLIEEELKRRQRFGGAPTGLEATPASTPAMEDPRLGQPSVTDIGIAKQGIPGAQLTGPEAAGVGSLEQTAGAEGALGDPSRMAILQALLRRLMP